VFLHQEHRRREGGGAHADDPLVQHVPALALELVLDGVAVGPNRHRRRSWQKMDAVAEVARRWKSCWHGEDILKLIEQ
jgi:hypothetical protein